MVFAVLSRLLLGIVLLSDIQSVSNEEVDISTLARIRVHLNLKYTYGGAVQYAINVPKEQCRRGFIPSSFNFLTKDMSSDVRPYFQHDNKEVYQGTELTATVVHRDAPYEHLLMNPPNKSPLTHLLNKRSDGCVIFYTYRFSPCVDGCLNSSVMLAGLQELENYQGMKAFVYTHTHKEDQNYHNLHNKLKKIAEHVPLYQCRGRSCTPCGNHVRSRCLR
ncbi:uncharacterized protein LOC795173 precursor [Danio rerio]|uniref:Uncharacterized protein LOC795173 precursor n=1 Tax=Danio rerio TaxID=7955 RepID=A0AB13A3T0_DANRE|nr:uncharacterized protein LOC795173 precursor [Danio rerio]|eukprot:XP_001332682.1 uncharacterized protein LOC795173 [Danio rerio]